MVNRREVIKLGMGAAAVLAADRLCAESKPTPIIDCHIHLFDTRRPGGIAWPYPSDTVIYKPALPDRYARIAEPLGVVGAIAIEASPRESDNDWVLRTIADHPIIVGFIGDLIPGSADYGRELERLRANPLFLGIRYGNLWNRNLLTDLAKPGFVEGLRALAADGLTLDMANPDPALIEAALRVSDKVPELRIVLDHMPNAALPEDSGARRKYWADLKTLSGNPRVFMKLSEIPQREGSRIPTDVAFYRHTLDALWGTFGEDHILYGSDWPNSDHLLNYRDTLGLVRSYIAEKGTGASEKFFWTNSKAAYRWRPRRQNQTHL